MYFEWQVSVKMKFLANGLGVKMLHFKTVTYFEETCKYIIL